MKRNEVDRNKISPMMLHYLEIKDNYPDTIILYRLGDFYEMFFEDAVTVSHELELTLTGRNAGLEERVPMCGVPHHAAEMYIDKLVKKGYKVAICEQLEDAKEAKGMVKRDVTQIISSGTILNSKSLNEKENNYIGSIYDFSYCYGITYADLSTGEIYSIITSHDENKLISTIISLELKEVIVTSKVSKNVISILKNQFYLTITITDEILVTNEFDYIFDKDIDDRYILVSKHLLSYLKTTQKRNLEHFQKLIIKKTNDYLKMDIHTKRNLELTENLRQKEKNHSLLWLLDNTKTAMGGRKLKSWIENPLINKDEINKRYDVVETLLEEFLLSDDLRKYLYEVYDLERLCARISLGNCNGRDLVQLKNSLAVLPKISEILNQIKFYQRIDDVSDLFELLDRSLYETPPISIKEGYLIKDGYSSELDELKMARSSGKDFIINFEREEKERTGIKTLKIGFNKVFGYFIEVSKGSIPLIKEEWGYVRKQTLANCERYITPLLKEKEDLVLGAEEKIITKEYELFNEIREEVKKYISVLQRISKTISEIDVLQSFALTSEKYNYVRPILTEDRNIEIINSRHPVVEHVIKDEYVPNDIIMTSDVDIILITGPNMSGKSTYMRQLGIIAIMAQIGSFVPATRATLPIFDKIFTRIGASDDLVSGESTFMVEMLESSNAILNATENSLILFDELGRGTATFDGMSLAQAILEYIHNKVKAKTLFSTHYHELTDLEKTLPKLKNMHVSAHEENGNITFLHKVKEGSVDKSYGIHVARLANIPEEIIERASAILKIYENSEKEKDIIIQTTLPIDVVEKKSIVEEKLKEINILELTPIDALNILNELKKDLK